MVSCWFWYMYCVSNEKWYADPQLFENCFLTAVLFIRRIGTVDDLVAPRGYWYASSILAWWLRGRACEIWNRNISLIQKRLVISRSKLNAKTYDYSGACVRLQLWYAMKVRQVFFPLSRVQHEPITSAQHGRARYYYCYFLCIVKTVYKICINNYSKI